MYRVRTPRTRWQGIRKHPTPTNGAGVPGKEAEAIPFRDKLTHSSKLKAGRESAHAKTTIEWHDPRPSALVRCSTWQDEAADQ